DVLPENLLKFYLHFSKPMRPTDAIFEQIELRTEDGKPVAAPWRRTELWSEDGKRLLLSFPRLDTDAAADLGYFEPGTAKPTRGVDQYALPGAQFVGPKGDKLVYIVADRKREGVYVANLE
ncbi:MAG: hypothetical protein ACK4N5_05630, partial [Myxococcales bacterium]